MSINFQNGGGEFIIIGALFLLIGLIGGGLKTKDIEIPKMSLSARVSTFLLGVIFVVLGSYLNGVSTPATSPTPSPIPTPTPTTISGTATNPTATDTPLASPSTTSTMPIKKPKLPFTLECVDCSGEMDITLKSITGDATGNYEWAFLITNKTNANCSNVFFTSDDLYISLPNGTRFQTTNTIANFPMGVNQSVEQDAFFSGFQPNIRYTLHMRINYDYNGGYARNTYQLYDFYF